MKDARLTQIDQGIPLEVFETAAAAGQWHTLLHPIDEALSDWPLAVIGESDRIRIDKL